MELRTLRENELVPFVDDLVVPFSEEMAALDDYNDLDNDARELMLEYRREQFANENRRTFVVTATDEFVGYVSVEHETSPPIFTRGDRGYVHGIYVTPEYRGRGIATRLLTAAEGWAAERDCERIELSVNVENKAARGLYDDTGFQEKRLRLTKEIA